MRQLVARCVVKKHGMKFLCRQLVPRCVVKKNGMKLLCRQLVHAFSFFSYGTYSQSVTRFAGQPDRPVAWGTLLTYPDQFNIQRCSIQDIFAICSEISDVV
jgi:hypothetical protein